ncbi:cell wall biosynthesis protein [Methanobacterium alcaliphilum]|uniref:cell wall biosynthesis protein n=1 Tax=Methanobacterium alcaliphilum TaxID=392018 RepID=UPI00200A4302|nr:cell wall biosynthesis protein [Methanobacterium alcaliphilum]MCK9152423.1 cell wall biosynthesis protein [Methanobacterium alcaliphilum]
MFYEFIKAGILSAGLTLILTLILVNLGEKGKAGNLFTKIRGGTPRAVGLAPFVALILFFPEPYNYLIAVMGALAFVDDLAGRKKIYSISLEWGQLCRGIGMMLIILLAYPYVGLSSIVIALMIQPMNIADMQPGSACNTIIFMSILIIFLIFATGAEWFNYTTPLLILATCIGYMPLDYSGRIMMGEVGNHSYAIALGISYYLIGGALSLVVLFIFTVFLIAFLRRKNLEKFLENNLKIQEPTFGDYFMDVLTGGGLGDLFRKIILKNKKIEIKNAYLKKLGARRLLYNLL